MGRERVELATLSGGAAAEMFTEELEKALANIRDCNTSPKSMRSVTMTLKIKPSEDRMTAETELSFSTHLAPIKPFAKSMFFGKDEEGKFSAFEENVKQEVLPFSVTKEA